VRGLWREYFGSRTRAILRIVVTLITIAKRSVLASCPYVVAWVILPLGGRARFPRGKSPLAIRSVGLHRLFPLGGTLTAAGQSIRPLYFFPVPYGGIQT